MENNGHLAKLRLNTSAAISQHIPTNDDATSRLSPVCTKIKCQDTLAEGSHLNKCCKFCW